MQTNSRNQTIGIITVIIILTGGGYMFLHTTAPSSTGAPEATTTASVASTTKSDVAGGTLGITGRPQVPTLTISATGGYTIKEIPAEYNTPKAPDYNAPLVFSASAGLTAEQKSALEAQAASLRAQLVKNSSSYVAWLALGGTSKSAGDYAQAAKIWTYVSLNWPTDAVALGNLGDLYMNFIKDYPKADASYLAAIRNDPRQVNTYRNLFQLYSSLYTTHASAAEDILKKGIQNNPEALDLYVLLARHYRDAGRVADAKAEYNMAIVIAKGQTGAGAAGILADIIAEQAALR